MKSPENITSRVGLVLAVSPFAHRLYSQPPFRWQSICGSMHPPLPVSIVLDTYSVNSPPFSKFSKGLPVRRAHLSIVLQTAGARNCIEIITRACNKVPRL